MALTALAGPLSNMLLALAALLLVRLLWASAIGDGVLMFLLQTALLSIGLGLFNLIPIPPLDGSKVLFALLPENAYRFVLRYERYGMILLWVLVLTDIGGDRLSNAIYSVFTFFCQIIGI
jgi:Zn-dependent protease